MTCSRQGSPCGSFIITCLIVNQIPHIRRAYYRLNRTVTHNAIRTSCQIIHALMPRLGPLADHANCPETRPCPMCTSALFGPMEFPEPKWQSLLVPTRPEYQKAAKRLIRTTVLPSAAFIAINAGEKRLKTNNRQEKLPHHPRHRHPWAINAPGRWFRCPTPLCMVDMEDMYVKMGGK